MLREFYLIGHIACLARTEGSGQDVRLWVLQVEKFWANWDELVTLQPPLQKSAPRMSQLLQLDTL